MSDTTETRIFKVISVVGTGLFAGVAIANAVYANRVRSVGGCGNYNEGEATTMLWINIIIAIIAVLLFIWSLIRLIFSREVRQQVLNSAANYASGQGTGIINNQSLANAGYVRTNPYASSVPKSAELNIASAQQNF